MKHSRYCIPTSSYRALYTSEPLYSILSLPITSNQTASDSPSLLTMPYSHNCFMEETCRSNSISLFISVSLHLSPSLYSSTLHQHFSISLHCSPLRSPSTLIYFHPHSLPLTKSLQLPVSIWRCSVSPCPPILFPIVSSFPRCSMTSLSPSLNLPYLPL